MTASCVPHQTNLFRTKLKKQHTNFVIKKIKFITKRTKLELK